MKIRLILLLVFLLFIIPDIQSSPVSKDKAARVAVNFYYQAINQLHKIDFGSLKIKDSYTVNENGITFYYVFNIENGGFVIVSAEDAMSPILGYSFETNYAEENPSPEFTWWMSGYKDQIIYSKNNNLTADAKTEQQWNEYSNSKTFFKNPLDVTVGPLILTKWNQGFPYNELCPLDPAGPGGHVYAGCVATAMAQIVNYYKYPLQGSYSHCYNSPYGYLCSTFSDSTYKWNEMPNQISSSCIPIASLLYQIGISVNMNYGPTGSSAQNSRVPSALFNYFSYSSTISIVARASYSQSEWENLIQNQLNQNFPIYYSGFSGYSGHAFNCDGYQVVGATTNYHFNWGWGGSYNGYFSINNLNPGTGNYNSNQIIVFNAFPETGYPYNCSGQKTLTAINGVFEDGSGHNDYQPNLDCSWLIDPANPSGTDHISLKFDLFQISDPGDIITVYDGENTSSPVLATFSGGNLPTIGEAINSTSPKVLVKFTTNDNITGGGWHISFSAASMVHCSELQTLSDAIYSFNDGSGSTYNYSNNTACAWKIMPENATYIKLVFDQLLTEVDKDLVYIYNDFEAIAPNYLGTYSGSSIPDTITSATGKMFIIFITDGTRTYPGWAVSYISDGLGAGIEENDVVNNFSITPNPAENMVRINFTVNSLQYIQLSLVDVFGNSVYSENVNNCMGNFDKSIDLSIFAEGIYIVRINTKSGTFYKKLVIK